MAAIIKMYTWWTIRQHKKNEEQAYKLVAVTSRKTVSGASGNSLDDSLEISPATDQTVRQKIKDGAVVFGIRPSGFAMDFEFKSVQKESVPGVLNAKMHGVFSLNLANPDGLGMLLVDLPELRRKSNREWTAEDLQSLFAEYKERIEIALRRRVGSSPVTAQELLTVGDSYNYSSEQVFPSWLKVDYLHTKYTYTEPNFRAELPAAAEAGKKFSKEAAAWEEEYNRKVEAMERQKAEAELRRAASMQDMDILNREHQIELAKIEGERNFFRKRHPELSEIGDMFKTYRHKTYAAYARIFYYFADHPILTPIILFAALMVYNIAASTVIPLRVQIRIEGNNGNAVPALESEISEYFKPEKGKIITALNFSDAGGGRQTEEFLLVRGQIDDFQQKLQKSVQNQQQYLEGKVRSTPAHYSFFDGGLNFALKKKVYVFTAKDSEKVANQQKVVLIGKNSIESDLKDFLENRYAVGKVDTDNDDNQYPDGIVFCFKLRSGISTKDLSAAIYEEFGSEPDGSRSNTLVIEASEKQVKKYTLDVSELSQTDKTVVGKVFKKKVEGKTTIDVYLSWNNMSAKVEALTGKNILGDWSGDTYKFKKSSLRQKQILRFVIEGETKQQIADFNKLLEDMKKTDYPLREENNNTYTLEYTNTPDGNEEANDLKAKIAGFNYLQMKGSHVEKDGTTVITYVNKLALRELVVRILGTPSQTTRDCLNRLGFQTKGDGYYAAGYYTDDDCKTKLSALNKLSPALSLVSYDNNQLVFQQKIYVQWKAPGLDEGENLPADGYFSKEEIETQLQKFPKGYVDRRSGDAGSQTITISKPMKNYKVVFYLGLNDDYGQISSELRKSFGNELRISSPRGNPPSFWFRVRSDKDSADLQEDIYELTRCSRKSNISVLPEN